MLARALWEGGAPAHGDTDSVLVLGRALHPPWNEGTRAIAWTFARVASSLRPVQVLSLTDDTEYARVDARLPVHHLPVPRGGWLVSDYARFVPLVRRVRALVQREGVAVAHLFAGPELIARWLRCSGARVVVHVTIAEHAYLSMGGRLRAAHGWRLVDRWVDAYALSSPALASTLVARGLNPAKLVTVPAAIDTDVYEPGERAAARAQLGLQPNDPVLLYVGTLSPRRFPAAALRGVLGSVAHRLPRPLRFFGFAPALTHAYNQPWTARAQREMQGIPNVRASVVCADLTDAQKVAWFRAADAVLIPFTAPVAVEPPLTLVEAMACGALVLSTPIANRSGLIRSDHNGRIYASPEQLQAHLLDALDDPFASRLLALRRQARHTAEEHHSFATATAATLKLWQALDPARAQPCQRALHRP